MAMECDFEDLAAYCESKAAEEQQQMQHRRENAKKKNISNIKGERVNEKQNAEEQQQKNSNGDAAKDSKTERSTLQTIAEEDCSRC